MWFNLTNKFTSEKTALICEMELHNKLYCVNKFRSANLMEKYVKHDAGTESNAKISF